VHAAFFQRPADGVAADLEQARHHPLGETLRQGGGDALLLLGGDAAIPGLRCERLTAQFTPQPPGTRAVVPKRTTGSACWPCGQWKTSVTMPSIDSINAEKSYTHIDLVTISQNSTDLGESEAVIMASPVTLLV